VHALERLDAGGRLQPGEHAGGELVAGAELEHGPGRSYGDVAGERKGPRRGRGTGPFAATASAELYDPASSTWSPAASMTTARYLHAATTLRDGRVLVIGGSGEGSGWDASTESYDPASDTWTSTASRLGLPSAAHATTSLADGRVLVTGGVSDADPDATVELYDAVSGAWSSAERMTNGRDGHTATLLAGGDVLVTGGFTGGPTGWVLTASAELFTPPAAAMAPSGGEAVPITPPGGAPAWSLTRRTRAKVTRRNGNVHVATGYVAATPSGGPSFTGPLTLKTLRPDRPVSWSPCS